MSRLDRSKRPSYIDRAPKHFRNSIKKKHLILDLDDTLICSQPDDDTTLITTPIYFKIDGHTRHFPNVVERPGLDEFLDTMKRHYYLHIFTTSHQNYAEAVLSGVGIRKYFSNIWHREHCKSEETGLVKDLSALPYSLSTMILIDDSPEHCDRQPDNSLLIKPFYGDEEDHELEKLTQFLVELAKTNEILPIKKKYDYYQANRRLPPEKKPVAKSSILDDRYSKIDESRESEREYTFYLQRGQEASRDLSLLEESISTQTTGRDISLAFVRSKSTISKPSTTILSRSVTGVLNDLIAFGNQEDTKIAEPRLSLSGNYSAELDENVSIGENVKLLRKAKPHPTLLRSMSHLRG